MEPILEVKNVSKAFPRAGASDFYAVKDVSFRLFPGEILGIVGQSGSGKSTVAKLITRLMDATDGQILVDGTDITRLSPRQMAPIYQKLQMVFQTPAGSFDPRKTLGSGIIEGARNRGVPKAQAEQKAKKLLLQCGLSEEFFHRYPHEVSGGQCQRAAIARALMSEPKILILDEATSALDVTVQKQIMELLSVLQKKNALSYIFICHNLALVQQFCDRLLVMYDGEIAEAGTPDEVILAPKSDFTKKLLEAVF